LDNVAEILLDVQGLEKRFGGIVALADYYVEIRPGELVGLIGPLPVSNRRGRRQERNQK